MSGTYSTINKLFWIFSCSIICQLTLAYMKTLISLGYLWISIFFKIFLVCYLYRPIQWLKVKDREKAMSKFRFLDHLTFLCALQCLQVEMKTPRMDLMPIWIIRLKSDTTNIIQMSKTSIKIIKNTKTMLEVDSQYGHLEEMMSNWQNKRASLHNFLKSLLKLLSKT